MRIVAKVLGVLGTLLMGLFIADYQRLCTHTEFLKVWECRTSGTPAEQAAAPVAAAPAAGEAPATAAPAPQAVSFIGHGWVGAGRYADGRWASRMLSVPLDAAPEALVGQIVTPMYDQGSALRKEPSKEEGSFGLDLGSVFPGDRLEIGNVFTRPSTAGGRSVWVEVRKLASQ